MPFCLPFFQSTRASQDEKLFVVSEKQQTYASAQTTQRLERSLLKEESRARLIELRALMQDNKIDY